MIFLKILEILQTREISTWLLMALPLSTMVKEIMIRLRSYIFVNLQLTWGFNFDPPD